MSSKIKTAEQRSKGVLYTVLGCVAFMVLVMALFINRMSMEPEVRREDLLQHGIVLFERPRVLYEGELYFVDGMQPIGQDSFMGKWHFVFFGFTRCPDICPTTLADMVRQKQNLDVDLQAGFDLVFVSLDTERDNAEAISQYLSYFDPGIKGIQGSFGEISEFASSMNAAFGIVPTDDDYTIDHTASIFMIGPQGRYRGFIKNVENMNVAMDYLNQ
jgi:protein SCO1/2